MEKIIGHQKQKDFFARVVESGHLGHAYIFSGESGLGKKYFAKELAKTIHCQESPVGQYCGVCRSCLKMIDNFSNYPDICLVQSSGSLGIDSVKRVQKFFSLTPSISRYKIAILDSLDNITREAANALLKTLEEPSGLSVLFLISSFGSRIPATIVSRCQIIKFGTVKDVDLKSMIDRDNINNSDQLISLANGKPGLLRRMLSDKRIMKDVEMDRNILMQLPKTPLQKRLVIAKDLGNDKNHTLSSLDSWIEVMRSIIYNRVRKSSDSGEYNEYPLKSLSDFLRSLIMAREDVHNNISPVLTLENLFLKIKY